MDETDLRLDGNAVAGMLAEMSGFDITVCWGACAGCGTASQLGAALVYAHGMGVVACCPSCGQYLLRVVRGEGRWWLDLRGLAWLQLDEQARVAGYWAQETHAARLAASAGAELAGIWGRDPAKTEAAAARFGVAGHTDLDRLLAEVDAVAIAVPPDVQADLAVRAAGAGRHLLLDKPLALSLDGADRVAKAVAAAGVASLVFFTLRFLPELAAWVEEAERAGDWQGGDGAWLGSVFTDPDSPFAGSPWRRAKGALWDLGPHVLSLALPVLGPVERVTAGTGHGDTVHLVLGHAGGASSTLTMSQTVPMAATHIGLSVWGPRGRSATPPFELAHLAAMDEAIRQLAATVAAGRTTHPCDVRLGRDAVAVLDVAERFLATSPEARAPAVAR